MHYVIWLARSWIYFVWINNDVSSNTIIEHILFPFCLLFLLLLPILIGPRSACWEQWTFISLLDTINSSLHIVEKMRGWLLILSDLDSVKPDVFKVDIVIMRKQSIFEHDYEFVNCYKLVSIDCHLLHLIIFKFVFPWLSFIFKSLAQKRSIPVCMFYCFRWYQVHFAKRCVVVIVLLNLIFEQFFCFEMHLKLHWHLFVQSKIIIHNFLPFSFTNIYEHICICKIFSKSFYKLTRRLFEHRLSNELKRT